jgi:transglutaminase-like putative cysteine protease
VGKFIDNKNLSVGYATALETVKSRQGDCTEHAVLAAAMCRAVGIPAQVVAGVAYVKQLGPKTDVFVPHAWFRVFLDGKWIDYDAALKAYDAGHITMTAGDGEPADFFGAVGTLGNFKIIKAEVKP